MAVLSRPRSPFPPFPVRPETQAVRRAAMKLLADAVTALAHPPTTRSFVVPPRKTPAPTAARHTCVGFLRIQG